MDEPDEELELVAFGPPIILVFTLLLSSGCVQLLPGAPAQNGSNTTPATQNISPADAGFTIPLGQSQATLLPSIADVVTKVKPSVVAINTRYTDFDIFNRPFTQEGAGSVLNGAAPLAPRCRQELIPLLQDTIYQFRQATEKDGVAASDKIGHCLAQF